MLSERLRFRHDFFDGNLVDFCDVIRGDCRIAREKQRECDEKRHSVEAVFGHFANVFEDDVYHELQQSKLIPRSYGEAERGKGEKTGKDRRRALFQRIARRLHERERLFVVSDEGGHRHKRGSQGEHEADYKDHPAHRAAYEALHG